MLDERVQICCWTFLLQLVTNPSFDQSLLLHKLPSFSSRNQSSSSNVCILDIAFARWSMEDRCFNEISTFLISATTSNFEYVLINWSKIAEIIYSVVIGSAPDYLCKVRYLKFLEKLTLAMKINASSSPILDSCRDEWWLNLIRDVLAPCMKGGKSDGSIRSMACDIICNLTDASFSHFSVRLNCL